MCLHKGMENTAKVSEWIICLLTAIPLMFISINFFFSYAYIHQKADEHVLFRQNGLYFYVILFLMLALLIFLPKIVGNIEAKKLFVVFSFLYLIAGLFLIAGIENVSKTGLRADARGVFANAVAFQEKNYEGLLPGEYLSIYPHQLGLLTFERLVIALAGEDSHNMYIVNLLMVLVINWTLFRLVQMICPERPMAVKYTVCLSFLFLPQFFFILFVYGQIPGLCMTCIAVYCQARLCKDRAWLWLIPCFLCFCLACLMRTNYLITVVAAAVVFFLFFLKKHRWRGIALALALLLCATASEKVLQNYYRWESGIDFGSGSPTILWITMGLQESDRCAGWYNRYNTDTFRSCDYDPDRAAEQGIADLRARLEEFASDPAMAADFFSRKILSTWTEPTFQSIWSGPLPELFGRDSTVTNRWYANLYREGVIYTVYHCFCRTLTLTIYGLTLYFLAWKKLIQKQSLQPTELFCVLNFLGGFLFHLFWETKSQYVYPYVLLLIPLAAQSLEDLSVRVTGRLGTLHVKSVQSKCRKEDA